MHWNSVGEFFAMGGRAFYVWGSFGACLLLMGVEPWLVRRRVRVARDTLRRERLAEELDRSLR